MLDNLNKQFQGIVKSIDTNKKVENDHFVQQMSDLNCRFGRVTQKANEKQQVKYSCVNYLAYLLKKKILIFITFV